MPLDPQGDTETDERFLVGEFEAAPSLNELRSNGTVVRVEPKAMDLLVYLARHAGKVVSRDELFTTLWPGLVVSDDTLTQAVIKLRKALGDHARAASYIQTVPKKGYRLIAPVSPATTVHRTDSVSGRRRAGRSAWLIAIAVTVAVIVGTWLATRALDQKPGDASEHQRAPAPSAVNDRPTLSVLPFAVVGNEEDTAPLAQGLTLDLVTDLARLPGLWVIGSRSILGQSQEEPDEVQSRYRVSGDVQRMGDELRIHVRLFDTTTNRQIWAERFHRPYGDLFTVQEEMSRQIADSLSLKVNETERRRLARRYTTDLEAYEAFLGAQSLLLVREKTANDAARNLYRKAIALDPTFGRAYAGLALAFAADYRNQWSEDGSAALEKAGEMARSALQIDPSIPEVYWVLAYVHAQRREHREALALLSTATGLDQSFADAYALEGGINTYIGKPARTIELLRTAIRLKPDAGYLYFLLLGRGYFFTGDWEQARINLNEALARNPANLEAHVYLAATAVRSGDPDGARWESEEIRALSPDFSAREWLGTYPMVDQDQQAQLLTALSGLGF